jgi:hypothetical protein
MEINRVIIRDINMPPSVDEFAEKFFRYAITSLINFFSKYDQIELDLSSRNIIAFIIPLRLLKMTILF